MSAYLPSNTLPKYESKNTDSLLPMFTRSHVETYSVDYFRNDPNILLVNPQDHQHIIFPDHQRGGLQSRQFAKDVQCTTMNGTIRKPFNDMRTESDQIKFEHIKQLGKDCPYFTYINN
jgi:hypothetical protein